MLKRFKRSFALMLIIALFVGFLSDVMGNGMAYAEEIAQTDIIADDIENEVLSEEVPMENVEIEAGEEILEETIESVDAVDEDIQNEGIIDEIAKKNEENAEAEVEISTSDDIKAGKTTLGTQEAIYYETNLKVKVLPASKNIYTGQKNIEVATPIFSQETTNKTIIYIEDDKGQIVTNNYGNVIGNAYDPESGKLVINIPKTTTPGKHVLTFSAIAPKGTTSVR